MRKMIVIAILTITTISSLSHAATPRISRETITRELGLAKDITGKGKGENDAQLISAVKGMKDAELNKIGLDKVVILKLVKYSPETIDALILLRQLKDSKEPAAVERKEIIQSLLDGAARSLEMNEASPNNKTYGKLIELLVEESVSKKVLDYAKSVSDKLATQDLSKALRSASEPFAKEKGMTVEEWLKGLLSCLKA